MEDAGRQIIPGMLLRAEPAAMRRWSKAAEPAYNEAGELIPFEDEKH